MRLDFELGQVENSLRTAMSTSKVILADNKSDNARVIWKNLEELAIKLRDLRLMDVQYSESKKANLQTVNIYDIHQQMQDAISMSRYTFGFVNEKLHALRQPIQDFKTKLRMENPKFMLN